MPTLLEISDELTALANLLAEKEGDVSGSEAIVDRWMSELGEARDEKLDNYAALIRELELRAAGRREEAERLLSRARTDTAQAKFLRDRLVLFFEEQRLTKVETKRFRLSVAKNGGQIPVLFTVDDPSLLPPQWVDRAEVVSPKYDLIRKSLEEGNVLSFAHLAAKGKHLNIR